MTPNEMRRQWYQEQAELFARLASHSVADWESMNIIVQRARLAGHFGRLALGQTVSIDNDGPHHSPTEVLASGMKKILSKELLALIEAECRRGLVQDIRERG